MNAISVQIIEESRNVTLEDLFIFLGSNTGLFFGDASFLSVCEIGLVIFQLIEFAFNLITKRCQSQS